MIWRRWGARTGTAFVAAVVTLALASGSACACSCAGLTDAEALRQSPVVFVGTLREVRRPTVMLSSGAPSRFLFDVEAVFKGEVHEVQSIVSSSDGASCGLELDVGQRALVFATSAISHDLAAGEYEAGLCGGTRPLVGSEQPAGLGEPVPALPGRSAVGEDGSWPSVIGRNWYWIVAGAVAGIAAVVWLRRRRRGHAEVA
jgi:hypothetical protein